MTSMPASFMDDTISRSAAPEELLLPPQPAVEDVWDDAANKWIRLGVPAVPCDLKLGHLLDRRLRVLAPIHVHVSVEGDGVLAHAEELNEYGYGDNFSEAIADLQRVLAELYHTLRDAQEPLGADLQRTWGRLRQLIEPRT